jgi:Tfp pilus assembly protein PilX
MHALVPTASERRRPVAGDESGFVLLVSILVMAALLVLVIAVTAASTHVSHATTRTEQGNQALAAADAGVQAALFELDNAGVSAANTSSNNTGLGNGASYTTSVTSLSSASSPCTGLWVANSTQTVNQDCVTSVGTQGGVSVRVQARVAGFPPNTSLFPVAGVFSIYGFTSANVLSGNFSLGSNGQETFNNSVTLKGNVYYPPSMPVQQTNNACNSANGCVLTANATPIAVPTEPASAYAAAAANNNNANVPWPTQSITYDATKKTVTVANTNQSQSITVNLPAGTYYFCEVNVQGANSITFNATGKVQIFIDDNKDPGACSAAAASGNTGEFKGANSISITDSTPGGPSASDIQMYFYGDPSCTGSNCPNDFSPNSNSITADVFAPYSSATTGGNVSWTGALVVAYLTANNAFNFTYQNPGNGGGSGSTNTVFYPQAQSTCVGTSITATTC